MWRNWRRGQASQARLTAEEERLEFWVLGLERMGVWEKGVLRIAVGEESAELNEKRSGLEIDADSGGRNVADRRGVMAFAMVQRT